MGGPPWLGPRRGCSLIHVTTPTRLWPSGPQQADRLAPDYASITLGVLGGLHVNSENYFFFEITEGQQKEQSGLRALPGLSFCPNFKEYKWNLVVMAEATVLINYLPRIRFEQ